MLDLRGNGGGPIDVLRKVGGVFLGADAPLATLVGREERKPLRTARAPRFEGELVVLVDAGSASASEMLARGLQLAGRAKVLGDRTQSAVRVGLRGTRRAGTPIHFVLFGLSITSEDVVFADGESLERRGVTPDEVHLPSAADLAAGRDPALAAALTKLDRQTTPAEAGVLGRVPANKS